MYTDVLVTSLYNTKSVAYHSISSLQVPKGSRGAMFYFHPYSKDSLTFFSTSLTPKLALLVIMQFQS